MTDGSLHSADLRGADLCGAKLEGVRLSWVNLERACLEGTTVTAEQLSHADSLMGTVLPDGTKLSEGNWEAEFEEWQDGQEENG